MSSFLPKKCSLLILALLNLSEEASAIRCGIAFVTKPCKADTDVRYNTDSGYTLGDQAHIWSVIPGLYYSSTEFRFGSDSMPQTNFKPPIPAVGSYNPATDPGWNMYPVHNFLNYSIVGSRFQVGRVFVAEHNGGTLPGFVNVADAYFISTHEKDGKPILIANGHTFGANRTIEFTDGINSFAVATSDRTFTAVGNTTEKITNELKPNLNQGAFMCKDDECKTFSWMQESYYTPDGVEMNLSWFSRLDSAIKMEESEWLEKMDEVMTDLNVPETPGPLLPLPFFARPDMSTGCATGLCLSEDQWRKKDPNFNESPYQDSGAFTVEFIILLIVICMAVVALIVMAIYKKRMAAMNNRMKSTFAAAVAQYQGLSKNKTMTPDELATMFNKVDGDKGGTITKEELKIMLESNNVVSMSDNDFSLLFRAIDSDQNGTINFAEFSSFLSSLPEEESNDA